MLEQVRGFPNRGQEISCVPLKIFTDLACIPGELPRCMMLKPFYENDSLHDGYDRLAQLGRQFLSLTDLEECEVVLLPFDGKYLLEQFPGCPPVALALCTRPGLLIKPESWARRRL